MTKSCSDAEYKALVESSDWTQYRDRHCVVFNPKTGNAVYENPECPKVDYTPELRKEIEECRARVLYSYGVYKAGPASLAGPMRVSCSPLVLDLNGDGRVTTAGDRWNFDLTANGSLDRMDWIGEGDAWLARDLDGSGCIESGAELFGEVTRLPTGALAREGFEALAVFDRNGDGQVDATEAKLAGIVLWKDDGDAICTPNELHSFEDEGIAAVSVHSARSTEEDAAGNRWMLQSAFTRTSGRQGTVVDVFFQLRH